MQGQKGDMERTTPIPYRDLEGSGHRRHCRHRHSERELCNRLYRRLHAKSGDSLEERRINQGPAFPCSPRHLHPPLPPPRPPPLLPRRLRKLPLLPRRLRKRPLLPPRLRKLSLEGSQAELLPPCWHFSLGAFAYAEGGRGAPGLPRWIRKHRVHYPLEFSAMCSCHTTGALATVTITLLPAYIRLWSARGSSAGSMRMT